MNLGKEVPFEEYILVLKFKTSRQKFYPGRPTVGLNQITSCPVQVWQKF